VIFFRFPELVEGLSFMGRRQKGRASTSSATRVLVLTSLLLAAPALAETVAITGGTIAVGDGSAPVQGNVVVRDGRIVAAGPGVAVPADARVVDATGKWVSAGLVAGFSRIGLVEVDAVDPTNDASARNTLFNASLDVVNGLNPRVPAIAINRAHGITRAVVAPDSAGSMFAGQGAVIDLGSAASDVTKARAFQFVEFGEAGARIAGGSRPASHAMFRNMLAEARDYARNPGGYDGRSKDAVLLRRDAEALLPVIEGKIPLVVHVEGGPDILKILALKTEFPTLRLVLVGATEGWTVAREIAAAGVPVIASALNDLPGSFEQLAATQSNIGRMKAAGVQVSIGTIDDDDPRMPIRTTQYAGNLVALTKIPGATGLDWASAFAAITSKPAEALGLGGEIGSLRPGRRADVVIWSGDPLELSSGVEKLWIDGVEQSLTTRQTRLRDRYLKPQEGALPKAYDR
jgi:imidazolonepropionase-like amidohydrolase